jgi:hypothetical protein
MGRPKGSLNKVTADVRTLAQEYGPSAIATLVKIMDSSENDQARIAAAKEILDRAYGKAKQAIEATGPDGGPVVFTQIVRQIIDTKPE